MRCSFTICALAMMPLAARAEPIHLACVGTGSAEQATFFIPSGKTKMQADSVFIDIDGNQGRARIPRFMWPPYHEDQDGWFPLINLETTDLEITGKMRIHSMNKPRIKLDRITGTFTFNGLISDFSGSCSKYDPASEKKF